MRGPNGHLLSNNDDNDNDNDNDNDDDYDYANIGDDHVHDHDNHYSDEPVKNTTCGYQSANLHGQSDTTNLTLHIWFEISS